MISSDSSLVDARAARIYSSYNRGKYLADRITEQKREIQDSIESSVEKGGYYTIHEGAPLYDETVSWLENLRYKVSYNRKLFYTKISW